MKDVLTYKEFIGSVHFSAEDKTFFGKIEGLDDLVTFEGKTVDILIKSFHEAVDDYIELCKESGKRPLKSCKGVFNIRIPAELHLKTAKLAALKGIPLNKFVQEAIQNEVNKTEKTAVCA
jgi:predicted HicB family RNase H-like nuclease